MPSPEKKTLQNCTNKQETTGEEQEKKKRP